MKNALPALVPTTVAPTRQAATVPVPPTVHRLAIASLHLYRLRLAYRAA